MGLRKQLINNFVFPTWACAAGFNNNYKKGKKKMDICNADILVSVLVEHRCYSAVSRGSSPQLRYIANSCYKRYPSVIIIRNAFSVCAAQLGYCSRLTAVKGNYENEKLAMVQDPRDPKIKSEQITQHFRISNKSLIS